jgi:hypothetical protein
MVCPDHRCICVTTDNLTHLMLRPSTFPRPAISKFRNIYEQIEDEFGRRCLRLKLSTIAIHFCRDITDTRNQHRTIENFREVALWYSPISQLGCCKRLLYGYRLPSPTEWREQVERLVVALKALNATQAKSMSQEMMKLYCPHIFYYVRSRSYRALALRLAKEKGKEERCGKTESTDSDSYSTS